MHDTARKLKTATAPSGRSVGRDIRHMAVPMACVIALHWLVLSIVWDGIGSRDGLHYTGAALDLIEGTGTDTHWSLRWPLVGPMALALSGLGRSEFIACLPVLIYSTILVALSFRLSAKWFGRPTAWYMGALIACSPFYAATGSGIYISVPETVFTVAALGLFTASRGRPSHAALAGGMIFLAWSCRETSAYLPLALILATLLARRFSASDPKRPDLGELAVAIGTFAACLLAELLVYAAIRGDAFYRMGLSLNHGDGKPGTDALSRDVDSLSALSKLMTALLSDSIVSLLFLGALAGLAIGLSLGKWLTSRWTTEVIFLVVTVAVSASTAILALNLEEPFYFPILVWAATLLCARGFSILFRSAHPVLPIATLGVFVAATLMVWQLRVSPFFSDVRTLTRLGETATAPIYGIRATVDRAKKLGRLEGIDTDLLRWDIEELPAGALIFETERGFGPAATFDVPTARTQVAIFPTMPRPIWVSFARRHLPEAVPSGVRQWFADYPASILWRVDEE